MANDLQSTPDAMQLQSRWGEMQPSYATSRQQTGFDGSRFLQFIKRNYKLFFTVLLSIMALAAAYTAFRTKVYSTTATVLLDQRKQQVVQDINQVVSDLPADSSVVDTEVQLLSSPGMAYQVARLTHQVPAADLQTLSSAEQEAVSKEVLNIINNRSIERLGLTYAIDISYKSPDPKTAQGMANAFAEAYINAQIDVRRQANIRVRAYLQQEITKLQVRVTQADAAVAQYKAAHGLRGLADTSSAGGTLTEQEISSYNQALAAARAKSAEDSQRLASASAQLSRGSDAFGDANSPGLTQLRAQEASLSTTVADLAARYGPNHPDLVQARSQLAEIGKLIKQQSTRAVASLQSEAQASAGREGAIQSRLSSTEGALQRAGNASVQLHYLEMQLDAPQKLLEAYQQRLAQVSAQSGAETADARIISLAPYPLDPSLRNWIIGMILGTGAGLLIGVTAVAVREFLTTGVGTGEEVEASFGVNFLAALPRLKTADDLEIINAVIDEPRSPFAESLRGLGTSVLHTGGSAAPRVLALTSAFAEEGKTLTCIALGRVLAMRGRRVIVIDCDVQRQSFHHRFGIGGDIGLVDVLLNPELRERAIVADSRSPARFLPVGSTETGQSLNESSMAELLQALRRDYDVIILDLAPVLQVAETRVFASLADTTVLLARWKHTSKQAIDAALAILLRAQASVAGVALTQVPTSSDMLLGNYAYVPRLQEAST